MADTLDAIIDAHAAAGPSRKPQKDVTYDQFQAMLDSTPLFMRETPTTGQDDTGVLDALKTLVFDGEGDGMLGLLFHGSI